MSRQLGPASPLTPNSVDSFAARYGGLGTPTDNPYSGGPYGAARPPFQHSPPNSQRPSGSSSDMSGRPSAHSSMARPPSSSSSVNRSSDGRMGFGRPVPNRDSNRSFGTAASASAEDALHRHYTVLRQYLASSLRDEKGNLKPNRARDKLLRLSATQFMELSTDVYDELMRREDDRLQRVRNVPRFLLPRQNFHPKRNQARQKLSTLPAERFRQLGTDVFYELERRTPRFATGDFDRPPSTSSSANRSLRGPPPRGASIPGNEGNIDGFPNRPLPKTLQQNTIVPNKGTMVEEDEEDDDESAFGLDHVVQSPVNTQDREKIEAQEAEIAELKSRLEGLETKVVENTELREKVEDLESKLADHEALEQKHTDVKNRNDMLQRDFDERITSAQQLRDDLERELDELKRSKAEDEREIQALREQATSRDRQVSDEDHEQQIQQLQHSLAEQQKVTNEVREQAMSYLQDMRDLSKQNDRAIEQEEKLAAQVTKMEQEIEQWRQRYAKVKAQNKSLRASTVGLGLQTTFDSHSLLRREGILSGDGLVKDVDVTHFQMAIDELLKTARQPSSEPMLESVKNVVVCVQSITSAIGTDGYPTPSPSPLSPDSKREPQASVGRLKARVTGTANSLITATKQHSSSHGLSPVVLLDAAASNLTSSVVELVKAVGIRPSSAAGAMEDEENMGSYYDDGGSEDFGHDDIHIAVPQTNGHYAAASTQDQAGRKKGDGGWFGGWGKKASIDDSARHDYTAADYDPYR